MNLQEFDSQLKRRGMFRIKPGLERIRALLQYAGNPQDRYPTVHIAGTNGKGSVAAAIESVCRQAGYRTGFYLSPHLRHVRERIQIDGRPISTAIFLELAEMVSKAEMTIQVRLTYFEYLTALAFLAFERLKVDIAMVEVGLGGLWDATNVLRRPEVCLITSIGLDHTQWLGKTRLAIAEQKAGIIKTGSPVISGARGNARKSIERVAREKNARLLQIDRDFTVTPLNTNWLAGFQTFEYKQTEAINGGNFQFGLLGAHQSDNAALAIAAIDCLQKSGWNITDQQLRQGLRQLSWPGRCFYIRGHGRASILMDGAHNPDAMHTFIKTIQQSPWKNIPKTIVFSAYADKDYRAMARMLLPIADAFYVCELPSARGLPMKELAKAFSTGQKSVVCIKSPAEALRHALAETPVHHQILVTGSLALVGMLLDDVSRFEFPVSRSTTSLINQKLETRNQKRSLAASHV